MGTGGHEYVIYDTGEIEGFVEGAIVYNWYPTLLQSALVADRHQRSDEKGISSNPALATRT